jgi:hypothetical protein
MKYINQFGETIELKDEQFMAKYYIDGGFTKIEAGFKSFELAEKFLYGNSPEGIKLEWRVLS